MIRTPSAQRAEGVHHNVIPFVVVQSAKNPADTEDNLLLGYAAEKIVDGRLDARCRDGMVMQKRVPCKQRIHDGSRRGAGLREQPAPDEIFQTFLELPV